MVWKNENPYTHIRDFEEVYTTFKEGATDMELLKLKAFPLTLKDKAKIWHNSLRLRTIRNWAELQEEFLKKFFSAHKTNNLNRQIYTFAAHDSENFISVGKGIWRSSVPALTIALIPGCW